MTRRRQRGLVAVSVLIGVLLLIYACTRLLVAPYSIPSGSMRPTLEPGDVVLVDRVHYGVRLPGFETRLTNGTPPARGDVMVFRYPPDPKMDYIKRVVGLPGDEVRYQGTQLTVNGQRVSAVPVSDAFDVVAMQFFKQHREHLGDASFLVWNDEGPRRPIAEAHVMPFPNRGNCRYSADDLACKVPPGHYFTLGDNRDNSMDSRYWGFVPEKNIVGRAFFVMLNVDKPERIGALQ